MIKMILRLKKKLSKMLECSSIIWNGLGIEEYEHLFNCHWLFESFPKFYDAPERCAKRSKFWKISLVKVCSHGLSLPKIPSIWFQSKGEPLGNKNLKYSRFFPPCLNIHKVVFSTLSPKLLRDIYIFLAMAHDYLSVKFRAKSANSDLEDN